MSGPATSPGWSCAGRSRSTRPMPPTGIVTIHFRVIGRGTDWFTRLRPGDPVDLLGPLGRPFEVDPRSRHLLLVAGGLGMAGVRMLADEAIRDGRQVTLLFGAASAREVYPSTLLPDEVEYIVATDDGSLGHHGYVTDLVPEYEGWADQAFACGPAPMLAALARIAGRAARSARGRQARAQARRRQGRSRRLAGRATEGVPAGLDGAEHGLRRRGLPRLRRDGHVAACRSASAARARSSPPRRSPGRTAGEGQAPGRHLLAAGRRAEVPDRRQAARHEPRGVGPRPIVASTGRAAPPVPVAAGAVDLTVDLGRGLVLPNPILVASGTFGYGVEYGDVVDVDRLGGICCKGTTLKAADRQPDAAGDRDAGRDAQLDRAPEPGRRRRHREVRRDVDDLDRRRSSSTSRASRSHDYVEVARRLDGVPGVAGIELNISCPNVGAGGLQFAIDAGAAGEVTAAVRRATDLPLLVKLSPNVADIRPIARAIADAGADALTAINTLSGIAVAPRSRPPAARQHLRRAERPGRQARRAAGRLRGGPGGQDPGRRDRRRHEPGRRPGLPRRRRGRGPGRAPRSSPTRPCRSGSWTSWRPSAGGAA